VHPAPESLECFVAAARLLNFRAAAHAVALTPTALGQRIRQLEDQTGAKLFERTTRKVQLTRAGLDLLPYARQALLASETCVRAARGEVGPAPLDLVLGTRQELGLSWILPMLPRLRAVQSSLTLHLYFGSGSDLLIRVRTPEVDCAVGSMRVSDPALDFIPLHREDYAFVAQPALLRRLPLRRPADAARHTLIDTNPELPLFNYWREALGGQRIQFRRMLRIGTIAAIHALVRRGEGVAVLPAYLVARDLRSGKLARLFPRVPFPSDHFRLIFKGDDPRRGVFEALAKAMLRVPLS
jgi:LysR family glycine cleavage system transcriptional activator